MSYYYVSYLTTNYSFSSKVFVDKDNAIDFAINCCIEHINNTIDYILRDKKYDHKNIKQITDFYHYYSLNNFEDAIKASSKLTFCTFKEIKNDNKKQAYVKHKLKINKLNKLLKQVVFA